MKSVPEMQNLRAAFAVTRSHVLPDFPIHRCLQTILHRESAALDEQITFHRRQTDHALKRGLELCVSGLVNIRVRNLHFRRAQQIALYLRVIEMRMVKSDRRRSKKTVEIDETAIVDSILQI